MKAKPTIYKGIQLRSRLEATWAAFFDNIGWVWEYEPLIYEGSGWLPDFQVGPYMLVEVKPVTNPSDWTGHPAISYATARVEKDKVVLLLGAAPYKAKFPGVDGLAFRIGDVLIHSNGKWLRQGAFLLVDQLSTGHEGDTARIESIGLYTTFQMLAEGMTAGKMKGALSLAVPTCEAAWAKAKNAVQWRPPA